MTEPAKFTYGQMGSHPLMNYKFDDTPKALSQEEVDRLQFLASAYTATVDIPLEVQLLAWEKEGEPPYGITLLSEVVGDMSVVDWLKEVVELRKRKAQHGVQDGVDDPDEVIRLKERAVVIFARCALEIAETEAMREAAQEELDRGELDDEQREAAQKLVRNHVARMVFFPAPDGAQIGKNGYIHLFPGYPDSPTGMFRGDGASFNSQECVDFIINHFPEVVNEFDKAIEG